MQHLLKLIGIDKKVGTGLIARLIGMVSAPIGSFLTVWKLSVEQQGLYYLFGSLLALRILFELGAGTSVIQVAAYARLQSDDCERSPLDPAYVAIVNRWMLNVSWWYGIVAGMAGAAFIVYQGHGNFETLAAWGAFITVGALQFASEGRWGLANGAGFVVEANLLRIKNSIIQTLTLWVALLLGAGLFSFCVASIIGYASQEYRFHRLHPWLYADPKSQSEGRLKHFRAELVVLIKKASQTYLTGYFVFQIQQPICFCILGAEESARLGFTQSIGTTFIGLPSIWLAMNFPRLAHHVADQEFSQAASLFRIKWFQVCALSFFAGIASWGITFVLSDFPRFDERLMDPVSIALLYLALIIQTIALGLTYWPRAFKIEPFVKIAYVQMILSPLFLWIAMYYLGVRGAAVGNLGSWVIGVIGIYLTFRIYWHKQERKKAINSVV